MASPFDERRWQHHGAGTVTAVLARAARSWPERIFMESGGQTRTFHECEVESTLLANGLRSFGVRKGDTVCALLDTSIEGALFWFAVNKAGAIYVPMNTALKGDFLAHQLTDADSRIIIAHSAYVARILEIRDQLRGELAIFTDVATPRHGSTRIHHINELRLQSGEPADAAPNPGDLSVILYTSGTTGLPKGCMASHEYVCNVAKRAAQTLAMTADDVNWSPLPLFHIFGSCGVVLASLQCGARVALNRHFSVSNFWPEVERTRATILNLVGSMIPLVGGAPASEAERRCFGKVRVAFGTPFPADAIAQWRRRFAVQWAGGGGYGLTEAARISELSVTDNAASAACGKPRGFEVRIFGADDEECPPGQPGEIVVRPLRPGIMFDGYWRRPGDTLQAMRGLWFRTGDIGKFDENGNLVFVDRKKDYIRCGGENISSYEIETALRRHPAILDVAAYAVPSALAEDEIKVSIILKPDSAISERELCLWAIDRLPYFCVPHYIEIHQDFPRSPTGKVLKYLLKEAGVSTRSWARAHSGITFLRK